MTSNNTTTELVISETLKNLGITPAVRGYKYLRYAIKLAMDSPDITYRLIKGLYPAVAKAFDTKATSVERTMRAAIESGWLNASLDVQEKIFGYAVKVSKGKPTNGEFIATVADYLLITEGGSHGS